MTDIIPDKSNKIAYTIGLVAHPAVIAVLTLILILQDLSIQDMLFWTALISSLILIPTFIAIAYLRQRNRHTYERGTRKPLYIIAWLSVIICFLIISFFEGPQEMAICMATLALWLPLQLMINHYITKVSAHTAVASGCYMALILFGRLNSVLIIVGLVIILSIAWARLTTKNHTILQVILGILVGAGSVLIVFPIMLN